MRSESRPSRMRAFWIATLLLVFVLGIGGYYWYQQVALKYDRITNAKRV